MHDDDDDARKEEEEIEGRNQAFEPWEKKTSLLPNIGCAAPICWSEYSTCLFNKICVQPYVNITLLTVRVPGILGRICHFLKFSNFLNLNFYKLKKFLNFEDDTSIFMFSTITTFAFFKLFIQIPFYVA